MESLVRSILIVVTAVTIALAIAFSGTNTLEAKKKNKRVKSAPPDITIYEMDPLSFLKRFQNDATPRSYKVKVTVQGVRRFGRSDATG